VNEIPGYRIVFGFRADGVAYELRSTDPAADGPYLDIHLPDATPSGEHFTAMEPQHAEVHGRAGGSVPWPVLYWFLGNVMSIGDLSGLRGPAQPLPARQVWIHDGQRYIVGPYTLSEDDDGANSIEVLPGEGLTVHGTCTIPWPVFRRFLEAVERSWSDS
jgi:hypothetical protein